MFPSGVAFPVPATIPISGSGTCDDTAVGVACGQHFQFLLGTTIHWDGSTWTDFPSGTFQRLVSVWGSGANDVWAVGYANTVLHWDGHLWSASRQ